MKILLRDPNSGRYYAHPNHWVQTSAEATDFTSMAAAARYWHEHAFETCHVVVSYEEPACELALAVTEDWFGERGALSFAD
jgi:hypothetical protein